MQVREVCSMGRSCWAAAGHAVLWVGGLKVDKHMASRRNCGILTRLGFFNACTSAA